MKSKLFIILIAVIATVLQSKAQMSASAAADQIGIIGSWRMVQMYGCTKGEKFNNEIDNGRIYIFKKGGAALYTTNQMTIANAKWSLNGKTLKLVGKDTVNDPKGIDYEFELVMVTPQKLVLKMEAGDDYIYSEFRKTSAKLAPVGSSTTTVQPSKRGTQQPSKRSLDYSKPIDYQFTNDNFEYRVIAKGEVEVGIKDRDRIGLTLDIPSCVWHEGTNYTVTAIMNSSMQSLNITSLTIPSTIKTIGSMAFWYCKKLTTISIPAMTTQIDPTAFSSCSSLSNVKVDDRNSQYCAIDNILMTKDCHFLILYPACKPGDSYIVPESVEEIAADAFADCTLKSVRIPASTTKIDASTFSDCRYLSNIIISEENPSYMALDDVLMTKDGKVLLRYPAGKLSRNYIIPLSVENISWGAFSSSRLESLLINNENINIGKYAFWNCINLKSVQMPREALSNLPEKVFTRCDKLSTISVRMPNGVIQTTSAIPYK